LNNEIRRCKNCDQISYLSDNYPVITDDYKQIFSPQTAYQMTSILEGVVLRGTGKKLRDLNLNIGGKTGTTNKNTDTWFIGFTSNLVIGVYAGSDNPKSLGKYETGAKTALPIFRNFIEKTIIKSESRPFKVPEGIIMMVVDPQTGQRVKFSTKNTIIESFKKKDIANNKVLNTNVEIKDTNNIFKFY
jgi:penicillin-binding protein 1A